MVRTRAYSGGAVVAEDFPVADISDWLEKDGCTVWADFVSPTESDLADIQEELGLHRLAVEDVVHEHQRPKLDRYDTHFFLAAYITRFDGVSGELDKHEITAFLTQRALVTVHGAAVDIEPVVQRWDSVADLAENGANYLLWGLLDVVVDSQFDAIQTLDTASDELEDSLFEENQRPNDIQRRSFELRKSLVQLRRVTLPMRDVVASILRHSLADENRAMAPYFQDVYDHVLRTTEWTETVRDLIATITDTDIGLRGNRMNLIMKKVTSWAAIIAVPTAITGFFGQNVLFPGYGSWWGLVFSSVLVVAVGVLLYLSFKKRDWL